MDDQQFAPLPQPSRTRHIIIVVVASIVVLGLAVLGYLIFIMHLPLPGAVGRFVSAVTLPKELRGAELISVSPRGTVIVEPGAYDFTDATEFTGPVRSVAKTKKGYAVLVSTEDASTQRLLVNDLVVAEGPSVRSLVVSPDGLRVAYTETVDGSAYASDPARSVVKIYYPDPGTTQTVGNGFAPFFIDERTVGYFTAVGIFAVNLETGVPMELLRESFRSPHETVLMSPDRTHLAWIDGDRGVHAYRVTPGRLESIGTYSFSDLAGATAVSLGNDGFYTIRVTNLGSEVWRLGYDHALTRVTILPSSLETTRLMFGNQ